MEHEKEVVLLIKKVLEVSPIREYNLNGPDYCQCPFCYEESHIDADMSDIKHELDCAHLIAKSLNTNIPQ